METLSGENLLEVSVGRGLRALKEVKLCHDQGDGISRGDVTTVL